MRMKLNVEKRSRKQKFISFLILILLIIAGGVGGYLGYSYHRLHQLLNMSFEDMVTYTAKGNDEARITVGIMQGEKTMYTVYGANGILPSVNHPYEIGSLTKTVTTSLLAKALDEGKVQLDDSIDQYLDLPPKAYYPTLERLATHTAGYKAYYLNWQLIANHLGSEDNDFYGIPIEQVLDKVGKVNLVDQAYPFVYSNFGMAVLGEALASAYATSYSSLVSAYLAKELQLPNTYLAEPTQDHRTETDLGFWSWRQDDAYLPAGGLISTIDDMLVYLRLHMREDILYLGVTHDLRHAIEDKNTTYESMNIHMDGVGLGWMMDTKNDIVWHNGATSNYNSYAAFHKEKQIGVVILSNCGPNHRIPATVMGAKLMIDLLGE